LAVKKCGKFPLLRHLAKKTLAIEIIFAKVFTAKHATLRNDKKGVDRYHFYRNAESGSTLAFSMRQYIIAKRRGINTRS